MFPVMATVVSEVVTGEVHQKPPLRALLLATTMSPELTAPVMLKLYLATSEAQVSVFPTNVTEERPLTFEESAIA